MAAGTSSRQRSARRGTRSSPLFEAFQAGLRDGGYEESKNIEVFFRTAGGHYERHPAFAAELAALNPNVILASGDPAASALKQATSKIPSAANEVGKYRITGEGGKLLDTGKYVVVWKREQGQWKLHRDIWNTSMPLHVESMVLMHEAAGGSGYRVGSRRRHTGSRSRPSIIRCT
jgi:hypothetical protein